MFEADPFADEVVKTEAVLDSHRLGGVFVRVPLRMHAVEHIVNLPLLVDYFAREDAAVRGPLVMLRFVRLGELVPTVGTDLVADPDQRPTLRTLLGPRGVSVPLAILP